jgi:hypothetical protein
MNNNEEQEYFNPQERELITEMAMRLVASMLSNYSIDDIGETYIEAAFDKAKLFVKVQRKAL